MVHEILTDIWARAPGETLEAYRRRAGARCRRPLRRWPGRGNISDRRQAFASLQSRRGSAEQSKKEPSNDQPT